MVMHNHQCEGGFIFLINNFGYVVLLGLFFRWKRLVGMWIIGGKWDCYDQSRRCMI
jgi:hypothetical protein